jgi:hypothetical protein
MEDAQDKYPKRDTVTAEAWIRIRINQTFWIRINADQQPLVFSSYSCVPVFLNTIFQIIH